jgi:hypothetical protein
MSGTVKTSAAAAKRDGLILDGLDGRCILVRGTSLPETLERAREWAAEEGYVLAAPEDVRLQWIRAIPCQDREHSHDGWECDRRPGVSYLPARAGRGAFQGILADIVLGGRRCPSCEEASQAAPCVFCGQLQDPACGYGTSYDPPAAGTPGRWRCRECGAITADDPSAPAILPAGFDWERDDRQLALEEVDATVNEA